MIRGKKVGTARVLLGVPLIAIALAVSLLAWDRGTPEQADAGSAVGMNLSAPANVSINTNFTITVTGSPLPPSYSGYSTEIVLPQGLKWQQRASCAAEIGVSLIGGGAAGSCVRATGPNGEPRHVVISAVAPPPLPGLTGAPLLSIDVRCNTAGSYKLALTAVPDSSFGAIYFDLQTNQIPVTTIAQDINGDTTMENIADGQVVNCTTPPTNTPTRTPTNTPTRTPTRTPTPTFTPCQVGGATCTPTPTNTPAPNTPTPTPLPTDTNVVLSGPEDSPAGGTVDVTANVSDVDGNPIPGVTCTFTIVDAPEGSEASLVADSAVTDDSGNAVVGVNVGDVAGTINVQADCGGIASQVLAVEVLAEVAPPETGADSSDGSTTLWAVIGTVMAAMLAGAGFIGWRKATSAS